MIASGFLAATVRVPASVPDFALQAAAVYRLEVGAACFAVFYLATMAFTLALDGRGFAEVGTRGLRATKVLRTADEQRVTLAQNMALNRKLKQELEKINIKMESANKTLNAHEIQLEKLEEERLP